MTIFHVLKYSPAAIVNEWNNSALSFRQLLPTEIADIFYTRFNGNEIEVFTLISLLEDVLLEYEGPL